MSGRDGADGPVRPVLAVVHEVEREVECGVECGVPGSPLVLELRGLADDADAELFAARIAQRHRGFQVTLQCHGPGRHTLRLLPDSPTPLGPAPLSSAPLSSAPLGPAPLSSAPLSSDPLSSAPLGPAPLSAELLADLLGPYRGTGEPLALCGYRGELLRQALTGPGAPGRHLEQIHWNWSGPLDRDRFHRAWQSLCERESILRAAFDWTAVSRLVLHPRAALDIVHHTRRDISWSDLLEEDRRRGFALHRPPLLRVGVLEAEAGEGARVLLTCHRALLDERGVRLLLREFYRAYLAEGVLPGGERRPDLRDHAHWLARQSSQGAREVWTRAAPAPHAATAVGRPGGDTRQSGTGRLRRHLGEPHSSRLRSWAAARGAGESSALHLAWALLLYRAGGTPGPLPVSFGVQLCARDLPLPGAAGIPGLLAGPLPMTVRVDPRAPLAGLLRHLRDALLDMAAYPWVCADRIREWTGRGAGEPLTATAVSFAGPAPLPPHLHAELRAQGIEVDEPRTAGAAAAHLPLTLAARHDSDGTLVLDAVYDRAHLADADARAVLGQCVSLLGALARLPGPSPTVGQALDVLADAEVPSMAPRPPAPPRGATVRTLRRGAPGADVICLLTVPGAVGGVHERFTRLHQGPETIMALDLDGPPGPVAPAGVLAGVRGPGRRLVLCGWGPGARAAYGLARALANANDPLYVVMTPLAGAHSSADALARGVAAVGARRP
ncbi:condensation domain-containing protein [Streptomyces sp. NPDC003038]|uniref:condensation domain-containing protein n=1 Tax=unclassified Streptomyces TaxID=2593676 RepID=UPI0033B1579D